MGYSRRFMADKPTKIATIPIGYADGLNRALSNGVGHFYINGSTAKIIGHICMDMCMLDVTGISVAEGDEVIVFNDEFRVEEIAKKLQTIPYEVLSGISQRVKRVYYYE